MVPQDDGGRGMSDPYPQIPAELKALPQWVMWKLEEREGKPTKIPYNAQYPTRKAESDRPETWSTFNQAVFTLENEPGLKLSGIGLVFAPPFIGVDLDHCRNPETGEIDPEALEEITLLSSYTELSPSGTGVHVIVRGTIPKDGRKKGDREVYTKGRFFTVTGKHLEGTPLTINESQAAIDALWQKWFSDSSPPVPQPPATMPEVGDDEILSRCLKNGKFKALFEGDTSGYPSPSEADLALCSILAMNTRDGVQIDRLFGQSKLYREKWDRADYASMTIAKALQTTIPTGPGEKKAPAKVDFSAIAEEIRQDMHIISVRQNLFYRDNGVYIPNHGQIEARIQVILSGMGYERSLVSAKREVLSYLADYEPYLEPPFNRHYGYLPVKNGILHIAEEGITLLPYSDEYLFSYRLPVTYDRNADGERLKAIFSDWVDIENVPFLIQLPAQAIVQSWGDCFKLAYLFEGPKNAAKTTYFEFLAAFIGRGNFATSPLIDLLFNRYGKYDLLGKLINICDELSEIPLNNLGEFKKLTGGMDVRIERKHCDGYSTVLPAVHAFTCNRPPKCNITDDPAWWDRWVYIYFSNMFPVNPQWKRNFICNANLSAFLNLVVDSIREIMSGKIHRMDPEAVAMMWTSASDTVSKFVNTDCERNPDGEVSKDRFFNAYCSFCQSLKPPRACIPKNTLTQQLSRMGITTSRPREGKKRVYAYKGIILKKVENTPDHPDQIFLNGESGPDGLSIFENNAREEKRENSTDLISRTRACISENTWTTRTTPFECVAVRILVDLEIFQGVDGKEYDCLAGDIVSLPEPNARVLIEKRLAIMAQVEPTYEEDKL